MTINICGEVNCEMLSKLTEGFSKLKPDEKLTIYFSSTGGYTVVEQAIINFINTNKNIINLVLYGELYSAGFDIAVKAECTKILLCEATGMVHFSWARIDMDEAGKPKTDYDKFCLNEMKKNKQNTIKFLKEIGLTIQELAKINKGDDVFLSHERMITIIENSKKKKRK